MHAGAFLGWLPRRKVLVRRCTECGTTWTMPPHSVRPRLRGRSVPLVPEMYAAARMLNDQMLAGAREDAEVRAALAHCPSCASEHFTESREKR